MGLFDFGKKGEEMPAMQAGTDVPVSQVLSMKAQGLNSNQIANQLRLAGYSLTQIRDALAQADIKSAVVPGFGEAAPGGVVPSGPAQMQQAPMPQPPMQMPPMEPMSQQMEMPMLPEVPQQSPAFAPQQQYSNPAPMQRGRGMQSDQLINELQHVIEEIIEEKWSEVEDKLNALDMWKAKLEGKTNELTNRVNRTTARLDEFSKGMLRKTEEYKETIEDVGTEMEAVEKLMGKLVPSLAEEIKELRTVVDKLKKK